MPPAYCVHLYEYNTGEQQGNVLYGTLYSVLLVVAHVLDKAPLRTVTRAESVACTDATYNPGEQQGHILALYGVYCMGYYFLRHCTIGVLML
jgi:hypothetical protein